MVQHKTEGSIYACQPGYGGGIRESKRQFFTKAVPPESPYAKMGLFLEDYGSSLLADAFNIHWKTALNSQLQGIPITRFAMLHDDVVPHDDWLHTLLEELDRTGADLVAAVVPIKDGRGLTSTAIDDPDDRWNVFRRLTMKEVMKLPETFSAADFGYPDRLLLANTGCWVCDFTKPWRFGVHFEIQNCIQFQPADGGKPIPAADYRPKMKGAFINQVRPEDWNFSRMVGRLGGTVLATRKVKLTHTGTFPFPNSIDTGGWEVDETFRCKFDLTVPKMKMVLLN